jgi:hypothetical protein
MMHNLVCFVGRHLLRIPQNESYGAGACNLFPFVVSNEYLCQIVLTVGKYLFLSISLLVCVSVLRTRIGLEVLQ